MARIDERQFKIYVDGQNRMTADDYMRDREIVRQAVNDLEDKYAALDGLAEQCKELDAQVSRSVSQMNTEISRTKSDLLLLNEELPENVTSALINLLPRLAVVNGRLVLDGTPTDPPPATPDPTLNTFGKLGKWFEETIDGQTVFSTHYPGASIVADISGTTQVTGNFVYTGRGWPEAPRIAVRVNGGAWSWKTMADTVTLATGLNTGQTYRIEIVFDGWNTAEDLWNVQRKFTIKSLTVAASGQVRYTNGKKNILFIGDSITAGTRTNGNGDTSSDQSAVLTYARQLADKMNSNIFPSAFPGRKVIEPFTRTNIGQVSNGIAAPVYNIHTVVVMMGTNDYNQPSADFITNYQLLIDAIRALYPTQRIYILGLVERLPEIRRNAELATIASSNSKVTHIDTSNIPTVAYASDLLHPSSAGGTTIANFVYDRLVADDWENGGGKGTTPAPVDPPPSQVPSGNLWTAAGNPAAYNPLPTGWISMPLPVSYKDTTFRVTFKASSASGSSKVTLYTEYQADFPRTTYSLTPTVQTFSKEFTVTWPGPQDANFLFIIRENFDTHTDINISDIAITKV